MTDHQVQTPLLRAAALTHQDALPPGTRLGEFEVTGLLGVGGFGIVYQAYDHSLQRDVAIKEYLPASLARRSDGQSVILRSSVDEQSFDDGLRSFIGEARLLAQFDHASLVKVFRFWEQNETAYMVMPLYRGMTLKQARRWMRSPPPEEWLRKVLWSVLGALNVLHAGKTMHRDISPENIFLQDSGPPVLLDLGAARRAIGEKSQNLTATLKFSYAPIEQYGDAPGLRQGPWTDIYSLAAVVYGCLSNELPLPATLRAVKDRMPTFAEVTARVSEQQDLVYSPGFVQTIDQALALRPRERPRTVSAFARAMDLQPPSGMSKFDWRAELGEVYCPPSEPPPVAEERAPGTTVAVPVSVRDTPANSADQATAAPTGQEAVVFSGGRKSGDGSLRVRHWPWFVLAGVVAGGVAWFDLHKSGKGAGPDLATVPATTASAPSEPVSSPAVALPVEPVASAVQGAASSAAAVASAPQHAPLASSPVKDVRARPPAVRRPVPLVEPTRQVVPDPLPPVVNVTPTPVPVTVPTRNTETVPAPRVPTKSNPESNCADKGFFAKPMCIYEECQKPEFSALPVCVDSNRRWRERRPLSN